ncbi:MAG: peptidoglycan editing factor PgeF [Proteobacteria bacterium]|nr:peptidoglycan editing factor PgeF [Pseudomonadota bacterium]
MNDRCLIPDWNVPAAVHALVTTRSGGYSSAPYASLNLATHVGDDPMIVVRNRQRLRSGIRPLPADPLWLEQVHGTRVVTAENWREGEKADACIARKPGLVCAVLTADCLPLLLCAEDASVVGAVHAGWRGLSAGVIEASVAAMAMPPASLLAWLGPAIGPRAYEVGDEVRAIFCAQDAAAQRAFVPHRPGKWLCDLYLLARQRLAALGVQRISGGDYCTFSDADRFYSYRRDGVTGRMASCIWLEA